MKSAPLSKKMFPVSLLLEGRRCLVVGGGRVAARKTAKLAEAGARLTVVAPAIRDQIKTLAGIDWNERAFEESDLKGAFIVFALTDDAALNRQIVEGCREQGILCSAGDASWVEGDLTMPAVFHGETLSVAVSTGGRACRRARLLREDLSRHIRFMEDLDLFILGTDLRTGDLETLEQCKAAADELQELLFGIRGVHEFILLSTCNRFEIIGLVSARSGVENLVRSAFGFARNLQSFSGMDAFRRYAEIVSGLQSEVCGETRIVAQVKEALAHAQQEGWAGSFLQGWTDLALRISKDVRAQIAPRIPAFEIEDVCFRWLDENIRADASFLVVGRGEIGQGLARRFPQAVQVSGRDEAGVRERLPQADVVICATGSPDFVVKTAHRDLLREEAVLIDLSLPRNIDPSLPGVVDLSRLRSRASGSEEGKLLAAAREIIDSYAAEYQRLIQFENRSVGHE